MADVGTLKVSMSLKSTEFTKSMREISTKLKSFKSELAVVKSGGKDFEGSLEGMRQKSDVLTRQLELQKTKVRQLKAEYDESVRTKGKDAAETEKLATQYNYATAQMNKTEAQLNQLNNAIKLQSSPWKKLSDQLQQAGEKFKEVGEKMSHAGRELSMKVTAPIVAVGGTSLKAAIDFESAFAGVRKTVNASETEFAKLKTGIRGMAKEIPAAATEIAKVAEAAGQLGIKKSAIMGFTRTMVDLGVATNMSADEAATALARFANITQMNQKDFKRLGSSVVALGNNFATTEREIVEMSLRLAGAGAQVGMTEADIMALATALSSVGIEAEMGGSAISRVMVSMQVATSSGFTKMQELSKKTGLSLRDLQMMASHSGKAFGHLAEDLGMTKKELSTIVNSAADLEGFARVAGMSGDQFKKAFKDDAIGAIGAFINGLAHAEEAGGSAIEMLEEMGISEIRLRDSLLRAGGASELFANAVDLSNKAWDENNALSKEASERYGTMESKLKVLWNRIKDVGITLGDALIPALSDTIVAAGPLIDSIADLAKWFADLDPASQKVVLSMVGLAAAAGPLLQIGGSLLSTLGSASLLLGNLSGSFAMAGTASAGLGSSMLGLLGPIGLVVAGLGVAVASGIAMYKNWEKIKEMSPAKQFALLANGTGIVVASLKAVEDVSAGALSGIDNFGKGVSESTTKAVKAYLDLDSKATQSLNQLAWSHQTITAKTKDKLVGTYQEMTDAILAKMEDRHSKEMESTQRILADTAALTDQEKAKILEKEQKNQQAQQEFVRSGQEIIKGILQKVANEKRSITETEAKQIADIQARQKETAVEYMSKSQIEQAAILETLKNQATKVTAAQAAEVVKSSLKQKDDTIKNANEQYIKVKDWAQKQRDELGGISQEQYEKIVGDAKNKRDQTVLAAKATHENVVREAKEQADEHVRKVDWETGQVKSKWEVFKGDVGSLFEGMKKLTVNKVSESASAVGQKYNDMRDKATGAVTGMVSTVKSKFTEQTNAIKAKMADARNKIETGWNDAKRYLTSIDLSKIGRDIIQGLVNGIGSMKSAVTQKVKDLADGVTDTIRKTLRIQSPSKVTTKLGEDTGQGFVNGVANKEKDAASAAKKVAQATANNFKEAFEKSKYAFKMGEVDASEHIRSLQRVKAQYAKTPEQVRKINLEIKKIQDMSIKDREKAAADAAKRRADTLKQQFESEKEYVSNKKAMNELSLIDELNYLERKSQGYKKNSDERQYYEKEIHRVKNEIHSKLLSLSDEYAAKMDDVNKKLIEGERALNAEYEKALEDRAKSLYSFAGIFDELKERSDVSGVQLMENLRGQIVVFAEWASNIEALAEKGIDKGLLEELRAMGPKAAAELAALNGLTDDQLKEYVGLWKAKNYLARQQAANELEGMKKDTQVKIDELHKTSATQLDKIKAEWDRKIKQIRTGTVGEFNAMNSSMVGIGNDVIRGLMQGIREMEGPLQRQARQIADSVSATMRKSLQVRSPSRVMMQIGRFVGEGLKLGMENTVATIKQTAGRLAYAAVPNVPTIPQTPYYAQAPSGSGQGSSGSRGDVVVHQVIHSPKHLSPSETARLTKRSMQDLALGWGR